MYTVHVRALVRKISTTPNTDPQANNHYFFFHIYFVPCTSCMPCANIYYALHNKIRFPTYETMLSCWVCLLLKFIPELQTKAYISANEKYIAVAIHLFIHKITVRPNLIYIPRLNSPLKVLSPRVLFHTQFFCIIKRNGRNAMKKTAVKMCKCNIINKFRREKKIYIDSKYTHLRETEY